MNNGLWILLASLGLVHVVPRPVDTERPAMSRIDVASLGQFYVRYDLPGDEPHNVNRSRVTAFKVGLDGKDEEIWRAEGWYAFTSWLSGDGRHLVRLGLWARGSGPEPEDLAIAFHEDGRLVKSYSTRDLVKDDSKVRPSASHYEWMRGEPTFAENWSGGSLTLTTIDDIVYTFDIRTGDILTEELTGSAKPPEVASFDSVDTSPVAEAVRAYYSDLSGRDWPAFAAHFHDAAVLSTRWTPPGATEPVVMMSNVAEFVAKAPEGPGSQPIFEEWPTDIDVRRQGDMAMAWVNYGARFGSPGALQEWTGIDAITLILHDGRWRITSVAWSGD